MLSFHYRWRNGLNGDTYPLDSVSCDTILPFIIYFHQAINFKKKWSKIKRPTIYLDALQKKIKLQALGP